MAHWKKSFDPSKNLEAADLDGFEHVTIKITGTKDGEFEGKKKLIVCYESKGKTEWPIGKVNAHCIGAMFGNDKDGWPGKRVTIHAEQVEAFGAETDGVRIVGSPDIAKPIKVQYRVGRKQERRTLTVTDGRSVRKRTPTDAPSHALATQPEPTDMESGADAGAQ